MTVVFLVHDRREELRTSLHAMLDGSDFPSDRVDVVVVDNASHDGSGDMVAREFPRVRLVRRTTNSGVSGFNDGFAVATGEWVLALDDDCYLPADGLRRALAAAEEHGADLVSFGVASAADPEHRFDLEYPTGLLAFWGCAVLVRREVLAALGGYDPAIFVWANEVELTIRLLDAGFTRLHLPEVVATHMKAPGSGASWIRSPAYRMNYRNLAFGAGKLLRPIDALAVLVALLAWTVRDALRIDRRALRGARAVLAGFGHGLRRREPVRHREVSRLYRQNFHSFLPPWRSSRPLAQLLLALPLETLRELRGLPRHEGDRGRFDAVMAARARYYPRSAATLRATLL